MLKPDKWQSTFDSDGKIFGFRKVLKLIILGVCMLQQVSIFRFGVFITLVVMPELRLITNVNLGFISLLPQSLWSNIIS